MVRTLLCGFRGRMGSSARGRRCLGGVLVGVVLWWACVGVWRTMEKKREGVGATGVLLLTQMRSGSSFTGHLLTAPASTFYTEEPVREFLGGEPTSSKDLLAAQSLLRDVLRCRFSGRPDYYEKRLARTHNHNDPTNRLCAFSVALCHDPKTDGALCGAASVRLARVVALDLQGAAPLLADRDLSTQVVHLVRDPRGVLASRQKLQPFGYFVGDALSAQVLCRRYRRDMMGAALVRSRFPQRYTLQRYEDLALHTERELLRLYDILGLNYTAKVAAKVAYHTLGIAKDISYSYGTERNSTATVFGWRDRLSFEGVETIQKECRDVLEAYGYRVFRSKEEFEDHEMGILVS